MLAIVVVFIVIMIIIISALALLDPAAVLASGVVSLVVFLSVVAMVISPRGVF